MKVLVACEFSGIVREAFRTRGHDALSCDLLPTEQPGNHYQGDVKDILGDGWDLMIAHPPCTYLCSSGARWWANRRQEQLDAVRFCRDLMAADIPRIALENPVGILSHCLSAPYQIIQPWQFGHPETKATCLWLKHLPPLVHTSMMAKRENRIHRMSPGPERWKNRSRTYRGIAEAMAAQWSLIS